MPSVPAQTQKTYRRFEWQLQELARQQAFKRDPDERAIFGVTVSSPGDFLKRASIWTK